MTLDERTLDDLAAQLVDLLVPSTVEYPLERLRRIARVRVVLHSVLSRDVSRPRREDQP